MQWYYNVGRWNFMVKLIVHQCCNKFLLRIYKFCVVLINITLRMIIGQFCFHL